MGHFQLQLGDIWRKAGINLPKCNKNCVMNRKGASIRLNQTNNTIVPARLKMERICLVEGLSWSSTGSALTNILYLAQMSKHCAAGWSEGAMYRTDCSKLSRLFNAAERLCMCRLSSSPLIIRLRRETVLWPPLAAHVIPNRESDGLRYNQR